MSFVLQTGTNIPATYEEGEGDLALNVTPSSFFGPNFAGPVPLPFEGTIPSPDSTFVELQPGFEYQITVSVAWTNPTAGETIQVTPLLDGQPFGPPVIEVGNTATQLSIRGYDLKIASSASVQTFTIHYSSTSEVTILFQSIGISTASFAGASSASSTPGLSEFYQLSLSLTRKQRSRLRKILCKQVLRCHRKTRTERRRRH